MLRDTTAELLLKPVWDYKDIMLWTNVKSKTTAIAIKKKAQESYKGYVPYGVKYVKADSVLAMFGTSRENELSLVKGGTENAKAL